MSFRFDSLQNRPLPYWETSFQWPLPHSGNDLRLYKRRMKKAIPVITAYNNISIIINGNMNMITVAITIKLGENENPEVHSAID